MTRTLVNRAARFRRNEALAGGYVVTYRGEVQGWINQLRDAQTWRPGCIAIDEDGEKYITEGGTDQTGADHWSRLIDELPADHRQPMFHRPQAG